MDRFTQTQAQAQEVQADSQTTQTVASKQQQNSQFATTTPNQTESGNNVTGVNGVNKVNDDKTSAKVAYKPKVCFLFGAGAELYYGMPTGARFAIDIFRNQHAGKILFDMMKNQISEGLKKIPSLTKEQQDYVKLLENDSFIISSRHAETILRELIQEHYQEIIPFFKKFGTDKSRIELWVLEQLQNDYQCNLVLILSDFSKILDLPTPKEPEENEDRVEWALSALNILAKQINDNSNNNVILGRDFIANKLLSNQYGKDCEVIDTVWKMPLFTVLFACSFVLKERIQNPKINNFTITAGEYNSIVNSIGYTQQTILGIVEIITAAVIQEALVNNKILFSKKIQIYPTYDTSIPSFGPNFEQVCPNLQNLMFYNNKIISTQAIERFKQNSDNINSYPYLYQTYFLSQTVAFVSQELCYTIVSNFITYKGLIDNMWRYLYDPYSNWVKFTQISCFLLSTNFYIINAAQNCRGDYGYYEQTKIAVNKGLFSLGTCATTNYSSLIKKRLFSQEEQNNLHKADYYLNNNDERKLVYLNGSTSFVYNPYLNEIYDADPNIADYNWVSGDYITVPLLFTQSGTKAMTVIEINDMYASLFRSWLNCDAVVLVGFNCGKDDIHINAMLRKFLDLTNMKKPIVIINRAPQDTDFSDNEIKEEIKAGTPKDQVPEKLCLKSFARKLHLEEKYIKCLRLIGITNMVSNSAPIEQQQKLNNTVNGKMWYEELNKILQHWHIEQVLSNMRNICGMYYMFGNIYQHYLPYEYKIRDLERVYGSADESTVPYSFLSSFAFRYPLKKMIAG